MKKKLLLLMALCLFAGISVNAYDAEIDGIYYDFFGNSASVTYKEYKQSYRSDYSGSVVIPPTVEYNGNTYSVTDIGSYAFQYCSSMTSVTIPESVTSIFNRAFSNCSGLTSVTIPNSVTFVNVQAFEHCNSMTAVYITDLESWCNITFSDYTSNPLNYARHLYMNGVEIKDLVIPNSVTSIGDYAFYGCSSLTSITIPEGVTSIGNNTFKYCYGLTSITIPNSVTSIGNYAFIHCRRLTSVTIPECVTSIGRIAFYGTAWYDNQPDGLVYAGKVAYKYKGTMPEGTEIVIKDGTLGIAGSAFYYCRGLTSVTIPESVTSIGDDAFYDCYGLTSVHITDLAAWCNISFGNDSSNPLSYAHHLYLNGEEIKDLVIPENVTSIGDYAFAGCSGLTSITIPNSVTSIGYGAFQNCI